MAHQFLVDLSRISHQRLSSVIGDEMGRTRTEWKEHDHRADNHRLYHTDINTDDDNYNDNYNDNNNEDNNNNNNNEDNNSTNSNTNTNDNDDDPSDNHEESPIFWSTTYDIFLLKVFLFISDVLLNPESDDLCAQLRQRHQKQLAAHRNNPNTVVQRDPRGSLLEDRYVEPLSYHFRPGWLRWAWTAHILVVHLWIIVTFNYPVAVANTALEAHNLCDIFYDDERGRGIHVVFIVLHLLIIHHLLVSCNRGEPEMLWLRQYLASRPHSECGTREQVHASGSGPARARDQGAWQDERSLGEWCLYWRGAKLKNWQRRTLRRLLTLLTIIVVLVLPLVGVPVVALLERTGSVRFGRPSLYCLGLNLLSSVHYFFIYCFIFKCALVTMYYGLQAEDILAELTSSCDTCCRIEPKRRAPLPLVGVRQCSKWGFLPVAGSLRPSGASGGHWTMALPTGCGCGCGWCGSTMNFVLASASAADATFSRELERQHRLLIRLHRLCNQLRRANQYWKWFYTTEVSAHLINLLTHLFLFYNLTSLSGSFAGLLEMFYSCVNLAHMSIYWNLAVATHQRFKEIARLLYKVSISRIHTEMDCCSYQKEIVASLSTMENHGFKLILDFTISRGSALTMMGWVASLLSIVFGYLRASPYMYYMSHSISNSEGIDDRAICLYYKTVDK